MICSTTFSVLRNNSVDQDGYFYNLTHISDALSSFAYLLHAASVFFDINITVTFIGFQVIDTNDPPTVISLTSAGIYENATVGAVVGTLWAQDQDANQTQSFNVIVGRGKFELF